MQKIVNLVIITAALTLAACGGKKNPLAEKKAELDKLKNEQTALADKITKLQAEIVKLDPSAKEEKPKLVALAAIQPATFTHYIDLQGKIESENIAYVTPRNGGGQVKAIYVKKGDYVKKGQLLLKLDDAVAKRQIAQIETQLAYAKDIYNRRNNLWKENIGAEVDLIGAKNQVDQVQRQMDLAKEQLGFANVYAEMNGVADEVTIRVGEVFSGTIATGYIKIVNTENLKVITQVPENYIGRVSTGDNIVITLPDAGKTVNAKINLVGQQIDPMSRTFYVEAHLPSGKDFKPNQIALAKIQDYSANNAITVPMNTVQTDEKGKFVLVAVTEGKKMVARKKTITLGELYGDKAEIKSGLAANDQLIVDGFQSLYDGQPITTK